MQPPTRSIYDLLDLDYCFSQQLLLNASDFERQTRRRSVDLWPDEKVDALRLAGVLQPVFRYDPAATRRPSSSQRRRPWRLSWEQAYRVAGVGSPRDMVYLYSPYQLLQIPLLRTVIPQLKWHRDESGRRWFTLRLTAQQRASLQERVAFNDALVVALSALEAIYRPHIVDTLSLPRTIPYTSGQDGWSAWVEFNAAFDPSQMLDWLGCDAEWVRNAAGRLLSSANGLDPLDDWVKLVRLVRPEAWDQLKGDALVAIDHRIAAEMLLQFYEDLARAGVAPALPDPSRYFRGEFHGRLVGNEAELDNVLMQFGLSPHPAVVLVIEGETESLLVPRVMDALGVRRGPNTISLFEARGVKQNFGMLARFVATPALGNDEGDYVRLARPAMRFIVAVDREEGFVTEADVLEQHRTWVDQIWQGLPDQFRTPVMRQELEGLVQIETWSGGSFEYAHFTDREIARAILKVYGRHPTETLEIAERAVALNRCYHQNLENVWKRWPGKKPSKPRVAEALWPVLRRKLSRAGKRGTLGRIPVARVVLRAEELAARTPRSNVVMRHR